MSEFDIQYTWLDFGCNDAPEINGTFADFTLASGNQIITKVLDKRARTTRDYIRVPLYPLAEWLVANWWCLFNEVHAPGKTGTVDGVDTRHCLYSAQEGFPLPRLRIYPEGDKLNLTWASFQSEHQNIEFISTGEQRVTTELFRAKAAELIEAVLGRLESLKISAGTLTKNWEAIINADREEAEFCRAAAWLGLDPYALPADAAETIMKVWTAIPQGLRADTFCASTIERLPEVQRWLASGLDALGTSILGQHPFKGLYDVPQVAETAAPWEQGYALARHARAQLNLDEQRAPDVFQFTSPVAAAPTPMPSIEGLVGLDQRVIRCFAFKRRPESFRFLIARSLMSLFYGGDRSLYLLTSAITERQQRERSFAAEFLIPAHVIESRITSNEVTVEEISDIAADFEVSPFVVKYQITNHRIAHVAET